MLKSHVNELLWVYHNLVIDCGNAYPALRKELERDLQHLVRLVESRGINVFCIDLPAAGKHLDRCVSGGKYTVCGLPLTKRCPRSVMYPQFLRGLHELIFQESGVLKEDCDVEALLFLRQFYYCAKKSNIDCAYEKVVDTIEDFFRTDDLLPEPSRFWCVDQPTEADHNESHTGFGKSQTYLARVGPDGNQVSDLLGIMDIVSGHLGVTLGSYRPEEWRFRHGPGAVSERVGQVNKYRFVNWSDRLEREFPLADYGFYNHTAWARHVANGSDIGSSDPMSRLVSVPKTLSAPRLIAAEPTEHQWCQQNIWHFLKSRCMNSWIKKFVHFGDQELNRELCRRGSVDGSLATLDLSSASDLVSCHFVGNLFRSNLGLIRALQSTRTRFVGQKISNDHPSYLELKKFSTMGSACTFPVETLGFLVVAISAVLLKRGLQPTMKNIISLEGSVAVFGDDIIVPTDSRELTCRALEVLHFKVNTSKSFWEGNFRESCGVDAYRGTDVSPVYWHSPNRNNPESIASALEVRNSFYKKGFWHTAAYLASTLPMRGSLPQVSVDSGAFGLQSYQGLRLSGFKRRINRYYQRDEAYVLRLSSRQRHAETGCDSVLLQFFTEDPLPTDPWTGGIKQRPQLRLSCGWVAVQNLEDPTSSE